MATNTTNYSFKKPDESDFYDVQDQNGNWDMADEALKSLDTPTFEDYTGSTPVPAANTAIDGIKSKTKLSALMSNIKAAFKGACLIGHIVNNCVTNNPNLPLSAAQGKVLMDLYTQLNGEMAFQELINSFNLNNATERKLYRAGNSATIKTLQNLPPAVSSGEVIIIWLPSLPDNSYGCQLLIHTSGAVQDVYLRHKYGSTWAGWGSFALS
jgi:hypothetical protein